MNVIQIHNIFQYMTWNNPEMLQCFTNFLREFCDPHHRIPSPPAGRDCLIDWLSTERTRKLYSNVLKAERSLSNLSFQKNVKLLALLLIVCYLNNSKFTSESLKR